MSTRMTVMLDSATVEIAKRLRERYLTAVETVRVAFAIAALVVDAFENGWPVTIQRPNGTYRIEEVRPDERKPTAQRVMSPVRAVYVPRDREGRVHP